MHEFLTAEKGSIACATLLHCCIAALLHCYIATLLHCYIVTLLHCYIALTTLLHTDRLHFLRSVAKIAATFCHTWEKLWGKMDGNGRRSTETDGSGAENFKMFCSVLRFYPHFPFVASFASLFDNMSHGTQL